MDTDLTIVPPWLQLAYTAFLVVLIPVYWKNYGPGNFLWFSDIALFSVGIVLWTSSGLLLSMTAVGVLALEIIWNLDYFGRLLTGRQLLGLSAYMFDKSKSLFLRGLSLFHVVLPILVVWLLAQWGYQPEALYWQSALAWVVLPLTYFLTDPQENINWVFGPGNSPQHSIPARLYFLAVMLFFPLGVYLPSHFLLKWIFN
ncbi:membrane-associated protein [Pontibacter anaerobius]|uniref:Membrane-associated protein n=1 Tax=Pontibacter anaerobius TaxID=2993940 RepID=A0ABT3R9C2_9BACT|nr:membrane-associated protein [Pontibacter anaerobius]MCX2738332.1 membrane-associated protein [Pontibacter anaerobius]